MAYAKSTLSNKKLEQLIEIARTDFDIIVEPDDMTQKELVGYLMALQDSANFVRAENEALASGEGFVSSTRAWEADRVRVKFNQSADEGGDLPIKVALNGRAFLIRRNAEVSVPRAILRVLDDCVTTRYLQRTERGELITTELDVPRFTYTVIHNPGTRAAA